MAVGALDPISNPQAWGIVRIAGIDFPGKASVKGWKRGFKWDVKEGKGAEGATETLAGLPPAKGSITFVAWSPLHFQTFDLYMPLLQAASSKNSTKNAVDVYHPALADINVASILTESIGQWEEKSEGSGEWERTVEGLEFTLVPNASAVSSPTGSDDKAPDAAPIQLGGASGGGTQPSSASNAAAAGTAGTATNAQQAWGTT